MKLGVFATHPVQYHVPIWRALARSLSLNVMVHYFSDHSVRGGVDSDFGVPVAWDVPLLEGYEYRFLSRNAMLDRPWTVRVPDPDSILQTGRYDWILLQGYTHAFERQIIRAKEKYGYRILMRGEFTDQRRDNNLPKRWARDAYLRWFYGKIDAFCYIGQGARLHLEKRGIPRERLFFSPYAVDDRLLEEQIRLYPRSHCRRMLGIRDDCFVFLCSGKMIPRKDPLAIVEALRLLQGDKSVALIILGDGPLKEVVVSRLRSCPRLQAILPGFVNQTEIGRYFAAADVFILPSRYETWGLVVNEAMQFGLPVVASDHVGCRHDLILEGRTGFVFPYGDIEALSDCMAKMVSDPALAACLGKGAKEHIKAYTIDHSVSGILQAIVHGDAGRFGNDTL